MRRKLGDYGPHLAEMAAEGIQYRPMGFPRYGRLHPDAERILDKRGSDVTEIAFPQVFFTAMGVVYFPRERIQSNGVDGKVATGGGLGKRKVRINVYLEAFVSGIHFGFSSGKRHLNFQSL